MIKIFRWTENLKKFLRKCWKPIELFLKKEDLMESKWGHRVIDQVFREGKFSETPENDSPAALHDES